MTTPPTPSAQILDSVQAILAAQGLTPEDLVAHAERSSGAAAGVAPSYPTLAQRVEKVQRRLTKNTKRTWKTHLDRLLTGTPELCDCSCDACLDLDEGCACGCATCRQSKLKIEASPDLVLSQNSVVPSDVEEWAAVAERHAQKKAIAENKVRASRGLSPKPTSGQGGRENAVTAYRRLFRGLVEDGLWDKNPAEHVKKGRRDDPKRRSMHDWEIDEFIEALVTGGDDPELDLLLGWFALETGARQGGAVSLRLAAIKPATQMIELFEKGKKLADQPVSAELIEALYAHAAERGGPACDPASASYDAQSAVFYFRCPPALEAERPRRQAGHLRRAGASHRAAVRHPVQAHPANAAVGERDRLHQPRCPAHRGGDHRAHRRSRDGPPLPPPRIPHDDPDLHAGHPRAARRGHVGDDRGFAPAGAGPRSEQRQTAVPAVNLTAR